MSPSDSRLDVERAVRERYGAAAQACDSSLCCPVEYDPRYLEPIPAEVLERDYGCGDPSRWVRPGERVLDLGSGGGKICFIASQIAGPAGSVLGVDMNGEMLSLARRAAPRVAERVGFANVEFRRGRIQDLALDLDRLDAWLDEHPVKTSDDLGALESEMARLRREFPLVPDGAVDLVLSNCVLNLVRPEAKPRLLEEIHRVVADGGRIAISDIVSDRPVPEHLMADPELWSGCVSGAFEADAMLSALEGVGFGDVRLVDRSEEPFALVEGIAFHAATIVGTKGEPRSGGCC